MISFLSKMAHFLTILTENQRKSLIFTHIRVNFLEFNTKFTLLKRKWDIFFSKSKISLQNLRFWGKREIISSKFSYFIEKLRQFLSFYRQNVKIFQENQQFCHYFRKNVIIFHENVIIFAKNARF